MMHFAIGAKQYVSLFGSKPVLLYSTDAAFLLFLHPCLTPVWHQCYPDDTMAIFFLLRILSTYLYDKLRRMDTISLVDSLKIRLAFNIFTQ